jgi:hypothetical protein
VRTLGDSTPSDKDLEITKKYVAQLTEQTSIDHLKSVDEMLAQVGTEQRLSWFVLVLHKFVRSRCRRNFKQRCEHCQKRKLLYSPPHQGSWIRYEHMSQLVQCLWSVWKPKLCADIESVGSRLGFRSLNRPGRSHCFACRSIPRKCSSVRSSA